jgi:protein gp37
MTRLGPYEVHPAADAFPLIEGEEFEELVQDIKRNGLREPIVLSHDKTVLIDGRNRYRACEAAGVDMVHRTLGRHYDEVMILDLIVSLNVARRHLNQGQKAMTALALEALYATALKPGRPEHTPEQIEHGTKKTVADLPPKEERLARTKAAKAVGASGRAVQQAKAVQRDTPDLAEAVRTGKMALDAADRQRRQRARVEPKPEPVKSGPAMLTLYTHDGKPFQYPEPKSKATFNQTPGEGISWAAWSWNPVTGCLHGCDYCYAREIATKQSYAPYFPAGFTPLFHTERLEAPANTALPPAHRNEEQPCHPYGCPYRRVFVCSMADLFGRWVPDEWISQVLGSCAGNPQWEYLFLTKFPSRYVGLELPSTGWIGTSVDEQKRVRIAEDAFRKIDGVKVKWLSLEPLREPLEFSDLSMFDWVVIGAQTETRQPDGTVKAFAPPFEWVARITLQALEAGCKVHHKPNLLGATSPQLPGMRLLDEYPEVA